MAHTFEEVYVYPPGYESLSDDERQGTNRACVHLIGICDGSTGEVTDRVVVRLSDFRCPGGGAATRTAVEKIEYTTAGVAVRLEWDRAPHKIIAMLSESEDNGNMDFRCYGGKVDLSGSGDGTGNIILTTVGFTTADDTYDIRLHVRFKED